jgi:hypothetical protein
MHLACLVLFSALIAVLVGEPSRSKSSYISLFKLKALGFELLLLKLQRREVGLGHSGERCILVGSFGIVPSTIVQYRHSRPHKFVKRLYRHRRAFQCSVVRAVQKRNTNPF